MQIHESILQKWMEILKQDIYTRAILDIRRDSIHINKSTIELENVKCKGIYSHLINNIQHTPTAIIGWENVYT